MKISKSIAFGLLCVGLLQSSFSQITQISGGVLMYGSFEISSSFESVNLGGAGQTNATISSGTPGTWGFHDNFGANHEVARAWALNSGGSVSVGDSSFSATAQGNAQVQVFDAEGQSRRGLANGQGYANLGIIFSNLTLISLHGHASGSGAGTSVSDGKIASANGGGSATIQVDGTAPKQASGGGSDSQPPVSGDVDVVGLGFSVSVDLSAEASASGATRGIAGQLEDALGAGAGGASANGTFDFDVIDPGSLSHLIFTKVLCSFGGNCATTARYPVPFTYTGKTGVLDNVQAILFNPPAGLPTAFGGAINGQCSVIYKIGVTQSFDTAIAYKMVANGPLIRFAPLGQTTARIDYPASWTNTCLFITDIDFTPPSGSYLPIGTNQGNAHWSSSTGLSGDCPFEIIVKTNLSGVGARPELLRSEFPSDSDDDGMADWQELIAGTETLDAMSVLKLEAPVLTATNLTLNWPTVPGIRYQVEAGGLADSAFSPVGNVILGMDGLTTTNISIPFEADGNTNRFYRIRVVLD